VWDLLGAVPEEELLQLADAMAAAEPLAVVETCRELMDRGREPGAVLQGLAALLRDLLLAGVAPDRLELTAVSPGLRDRLPPSARRIGRDRLLRWQAQLKGSEQQLRQSVQPRLWLEVLLLGLLAEPAAVAAAVPSSSVPAVASTSPAHPAAAGASEPPPAPAAPHPSAPHPSAPEPQPAASAAPVPSAATPDLTTLWQEILAGLELPSTRMLLAQQARLERLEAGRVVVRVAGPWMAMVQSRLPLLEKAVTRVIEAPGGIVLEAGGEPRRAAAPTPAPPAAAPAPAMAAVPAVTPPPPASAAPARSTAPAAPAAAPEPSPPDPPRHAAAPAPGRPPAGTAPIDEKARRLAEFFNGEVVADPDGTGLDEELLGGNVA
jgi:DNA polymerase-3 subunit gamma/tau